MLWRPGNASSWNTRDGFIPDTRKAEQGQAAREGVSMRVGEIIHEIEVLPDEEPVVLPEPLPESPAPQQEPEPA